MKASLKQSDEDEPTSDWKARQTAAYRELHATVAAILLRHDPVGINFGTNSDEYEPEASTILRRLQLAKSSHDPRRIVREEFHHWFGGSTMSYNTLDAAGDEIWHDWQVSGLSKGR